MKNTPTPDLIDQLTLDEKASRAVKMEANYTGFPVDDVFVVGYGLDYDNRYRELPHIAKVTFLNK